MIADYFFPDPTLTYYAGEMTIQFDITEKLLYKSTVYDIDKKEGHLTVFMDFDNSRTYSLPVKLTKLDETTHRVEIFLNSNLFNGSGTVKVAGFYRVASRGSFEAKPIRKAYLLEQ